MFLYLDDVRIPQGNNLYVVKNYNNCIEMIKNNKIDFLSLDHDLGENKTGYDVIKFLIQEGIKIKHINIHSRNPVGGEIICDS